MLSPRTVYAIYMYVGSSLLLALQLISMLSPRTVYDIYMYWVSKKMIHFSNGNIFLNPGDTELDT